MRRFRCETCQNEVFFDSTVCQRCRSRLGYEPTADEMLGVGGPVAREAGLVACANAEIARCNWLAPSAGGLCRSCTMTRTRPSDADGVGLRLFPLAEESKRHLIRDLTRLNFPLPVTGTPEGSGVPLSFDLLSSVAASVTIGHANGVITIDLAEGDHSHRERVRQQLAEPYRTMLGHFRHESGHYAQWQLVDRSDRIEESRELFGDERQDYQAALDAHYQDGPPADWPQRYISSYATMHPWEDFAECWAHYLHIQDAIETAVAFGLIAEPDDDISARRLILEVWLPFATAMNVVNRSLGRRDLYPFVLLDPVLDKLAFVHSLRQAAA